MKASNLYFVSVLIFPMQGVFYLSSTILLGTQHNGLIFAAYNGEYVEINGGIPLTGLTWQTYNVSTSPYRSIH